MSLEEQEVGKAHIFHHSIIPLIFRLFFLTFIVVGLSVVFDLIASVIADDVDIQNLFLVRSVITTFLIIVFVSIAVYTTIRWLSDLVIIEGKRIIYRKGLAVVKEDVHTFSGLPTININQSFIAKRLNYGSIEITRLTSEGGRILLPDMPNPQHIMKVLEENIPPSSK